MIALLPLVSADCSWYRGSAKALYLQGDLFGGTDMKKRKTQPVEIAPRIIVDSRMRFGRPVIKGTRVPVAVILDEMAAGTDPDDVAREYGITGEDLRAVLRYAAELVAGEELKVASG
jgi:uncharacterized protein (DUF433 family)